ncbi:MAG TPA: nucleotidyltransferase domain-containing protein [Planctomycetota bacterium]|nr:nucleotidyltransferase domain-containing protein [Planctomycetota bacterium]
MVLGLRHSKDASGCDIDLGSISGLLDRIVDTWHPRGIWLFGSRARGGAKPASDWDFLIVVPDDQAGVDDPLTAWRLQKESGVSSDLVLCRATDFHEDRNTPNTLAFEAAHGGVLIYER